MASRTVGETVPPYNEDEVYDVGSIPEPADPRSFISRVEQEARTSDTQQQLSKTQTTARKQTMQSAASGIALHNTNNSRQTVSAAAQVALQKHEPANCIRQH